MSAGIRVAALAGLLSACSSTLAPGGTGAAGAGGTGGTSGPGGVTGTGGSASGGTGGCATLPPPSAAPFNCEPTYDQQLTALCQPRDYPTFRQAGQCDPWQVTMYGTNYSTIWCAYDAAGALVEARRCEDSTAYCGSFCITSANPSGAIVACSSLPDVCDTSAGAASD